MANAQGWNEAVESYSELEMVPLDSAAAAVQVWIASAAEGGFYADELKPAVGKLVRIARRKLGPKPRKIERALTLDEACATMRQEKADGDATPLVSFLRVMQAFAALSEPEQVAFATLAKSAAGMADDRDVVRDAGALTLVEMRRVHHVATLVNLAEVWRTWQPETLFAQQTMAFSMRDEHFVKAAIDADARSTSM